MNQQKQVQISTRFFQRGFTRRECIENWAFRRPSFLAQLRNTHPLPRLQELCNSQTNPRRVVIIYSMMSLDSFFVLPYVMETFQECRQISIRYFAFEHFFPFFQGHILREFPQIFILDSKDMLGPSWGPRAEAPEIQAWDDESLSQFAIKNYPARLDDSLFQFFSTHLSSASVE